MIGSDDPKSILGKESNCQYIRHLVHAEQYHTVGSPPLPEPGVPDDRKMPFTPSLLTPPMDGVDETTPSPSNRPTGGVSSRRLTENEALGDRVSENSSGSINHPTHPIS